MNLCDLHDSIFIGLSVDRNKRGQLLFEVVGGQKTTLVLEDVEYLLANEFREGNIVLDVVIEKGVDFERKYLDQLFGKEYLQKNNALRDSLTAKIASGKLSLVAIEPSYGCALVALCKSYSWTES